MGPKWTLLPVLALYWFAIVSPVSAYRVVCYYVSRTVYRGQAIVAVDVDPNACTHVIFGFVGFNANGTVKILDSWSDVDKAAFEGLSCLKKANPKLKTLIAIGGWNEGPTGFSTVARDSTRRAAFIKSAIDLIVKFGYDGFDLDWEYLNQRGGPPVNLQYFMQLVKELSEAFKPKGLLLTAAVSALLSYDVAQIDRYFDFINVMTYDLHGCWESVTGHKSPLRASPDGLDVETCTFYWLYSGASPEKLNLGITFTGRSFTLKDPNNNGIGAPVSGCGQAGSDTRQTGTLSYNEICKNNWPRRWHEVQKVPYAFQSNQWVGYDDPESIGHKIGFLKSASLGGAMIWSLETDDFSGACGQGRNSLLNAVRSGLGLPSSTGPPLGSPCGNGTIIWWSSSPDAEVGESNPGIIH